MPDTPNNSRSVYDWYLRGFTSALAKAPIVDPGADTAGAAAYAMGWQAGQKGHMVNRTEVERVVKALTATREAND